MNSIWLRIYVLHKYKHGEICRGISGTAIKYKAKVVGSNKIFLITSFGNRIKRCGGFNYRHYSLHNVTKKLQKIEKMSVITLCFTCLICCM